MLIHFVFDILAILSSLLMGRYFKQRYQLTNPSGITNSDTKNYYLVALLVGLALGSVGLGTLNVYISGQSGIAKSILGGIVGAIIAAEIFKYFAGIKQSTGLYFVPGLIVLIGVGRIGCFLAGLPDFTYGIETNLPWGYDFGDGIKRHPVQLYETLTMFLLLIVLFSTYNKYKYFWLHYGFYTFIIVYATQRFCWEFLKPYSTIASSLNLFQWLCLALIVYAVVMIRYNTISNFRKSTT